MKGRERWRQGKAKRSRGGAKSGRRRRRKMVHRACVVDLRVQVWPRVPFCPSMDGVVIHRSKAGHGSPRQQLGQDSLFTASPALSCRMWSPAQTAAAQAVLPPRMVTGGLGKVPVSFLFPAQVPRRHGSNWQGLQGKGSQQAVGDHKGRRKREQEGQRELLAVHTPCAQW